ncbi:MAG: primosomal protein N', partial [Coriobacteriia bacterium]|nr:primosomal protein N' [Coriobacteriia bacterium]
SIVLSERVNKRSLPPVELIDMAQEFGEGHRKMFSRTLLHELNCVIEREEKAVMLLNRRGFAHFLLCRECGYVPRCEHCSTSLTVHERTHTLECHTCGRSYPMLVRCPECDSPYLRAFGSGTQRVEDELKALLSDQVEIIRMDADTTKGKLGHEKVLESFDNAKCAVLLGTQMIAKGLDFPEVTLAAVINADTTLNVPDFRAAEKTYSLLEQFAGRAGRGEKPGKVLIQTYWAEHPALKAVASHNRDLFLKQALSERKEAGYPPFVQLANIIMWGSHEKLVMEELTKLYEVMRAHQRAQKLEGLEFLGPVACIIAKAQDKYRYHLLIKAPLDFKLAPLIMGAIKEIRVQKSISLAIDINPYDFM